MTRTLFGLLAGAMVCVLLPHGELGAQEVRIGDLTVSGGEGPVRLVGYGLVVGLANTGDRNIGGRDGGMTVRSVANLLRNLGIDVPEEVVRTRNAAAVLVTAEASPYTRRGGRFDVTVASVGDATSLQGGMLWTTPLFVGVGGAPLASAQGTLAFPMSEGRRYGSVETSAFLTGGGVAMSDFATVAEAPLPDLLLLSRPDLATAQRIAEAVNAELGAGTATVEDPGAVRLALSEDDPLVMRARISELLVLPAQEARVVIDARSGAVAAGGGIEIGPAVVSHEWLTVTIFGDDPGSEPEGPPAPGGVRVAAGVQVQALVEALHGVGAPADLIGTVFQSLQRVGALRAEVRIQ